MELFSATTIYILVKTASTWLQAAEMDGKKPRSIFVELIVAPNNAKISMPERAHREMNDRRIEMESVLFGLP